jgi:GntR family transcriptional regulator
MASKYDRIAADLRRQIQNGQLAPGQRLRAETALAEEYRVTVATLRRGLDQLEAEGLIERQHGIGNFVREPRPRVRRTTDRYQWEKDRALLPDDERRQTGATEYDTGLELPALEFHADYSDCEADDDLAEALQVPVGTPLLERTYRTRNKTEDAWLSLSRSYLIRDLVAGNPALLDASNEPWPGGTMHQLHTVGIEVDRITDTITARPPAPDEADALGLTGGVSVIVQRKTLTDVNGRIVEVADVVLPGDRTELVYTTQLKRWPS